MRGVEIYLRPSGDRVLLNIYVPRKVSRRLSEGLKEGRFEGREVPIHLELSALPQWYSGQADGHIRVPIASINVIEED